ncbi:hypothetical protein SLEP1_g57961 [Rubroshorea leprosula]|uniref:RRM domain-containing protein n=1 Tax=Rubroshorea leprosula TaxID=152421 RepID=A0AAV5MMT2_9ROSI|nr:hypothetical protein SLEP1_g57961 [Rubroshorea leprosula]
MRESRRYQRNSQAITGQGESRRTRAFEDQKRLGRFSKFSKTLLMNSWCYLVSNFPEEWSSEKLWLLFSRYGKVLDVHVSKKPDRRGGRYGFVRFLNARSSSELEERLNRENQKTRWVVKEAVKKANREQVVVKEGVRSNGKDSRSFVDVVKGNQQVRSDRNGKSEDSCSEKKMHGMTVEEGRKDVGVEYEVDEKDYQWLEACAVGYVNAVEVIPSSRISWRWGDSTKLQWSLCAKAWYC